MILVIRKNEIRHVPKAIPQILPLLHLVIIYIGKMSTGTVISGGSASLIYLPIISSKW